MNPCRTSLSSPSVSPAADTGPTSFVLGVIGGRWAVGCYPRFLHEPVPAPLSTTR